MIEDSGVWDIWFQAANILFNTDQDATLWDLAKAMYRYFNNRDMPIEELNDYDLVYYHKKGYSTMDIAFSMDVSDEAVWDYLNSMGFNPWKKALLCNCYAVVKDYKKNNSMKEICSTHEISRYIVEKIIKEFRHAEITGF